MMGRVWTALLRAASVRLWALILAGPPLTAGAAGLVWIVWRGPWPLDLARDQLKILGFALYIALALIGVIIIALASVKVKGQALGGSFEVEADDAAPALAVTTTTTTTAATAAATSATGAP